MTKNNASFVMEILNVMKYIEIKASNGEGK